MGRPGEVAPEVLSGSYGREPQSQCGLLERRDLEEQKQGRVAELEAMDRGATFGALELCASCCCLESLPLQGHPA